MDDNENIYATCNETGEMYPFGMFNWYFFNDTCPRAGPLDRVGKNIHKFLISFSACSDNEFTCMDGSW